MGSGPAGASCGSCTYCEIFHYRKTYHKCRAREGDHWKGGRATDIRPMDPACSKYEPAANVRAPAPALPALPVPDVPKPAPRRQPADPGQMTMLLED